MNPTLQLIAAPAALPMIFVAAAIFVLGVVVVAREHHGTVSLSFLSLTLSVSLWLASISAMLVVTDPLSAFLFARIAYVGVALIPAAILQFTFALLGMNRHRSQSLAVVWTVSAAFALVFTTSHRMLAGTWHYSWGYYPLLAPASIVFLVYFAAVLIAALYFLATTTTKSHQERLRNRSFLLALGIGYLGSIDFAPAFGVDLYPFGCIAILAFIALSVLSILRFRLTDLSPSFVAERLLQTMHGGVIVVDTEGCVQVANEVAAGLLGWSVADMHGIDFRSLLGVTVLPVTDSDSFCRRSITRKRIVSWRRHDGTILELSLSASALCDQRGNSVGVLYALADVSDLKRAEANEYGATHDLLTRLPNRAQFARSFREKKDQMIAAGRVPSVLFVDLDGFKAVNDRHGHAAGDALLQLVAARIRNSIRGDDVLARYGGDEFVVLLDLARREDVSLVGRKLLNVVSAPYSIDEKTINITASIGAAFHTTDGSTADELMRVADGAMYRAKRAGKARIHIGQPPRTDTSAPPPYPVDARA